MVKRYKKKDPHKKRESEKYEFPVPSRELLLQYLDEVVRPVTFRHIVKAFNISAEEELEGVRRRLKAMIRDGQIIRNRRGSFAVASQMALVSGRVIGHPDGFGFVEADDGGSDIFLHAKQMRQVLPNDRVMVRVISEKAHGRREGAITEVLERNTTHVAGRFYIESGVALVDPDNRQMSQDIIIQPGEEDGATHGCYVEVELIAQPNMRRQPMGRVVEVLGDNLTPGMEVDLAVRAHDLPSAWPEAVLEQAQTLNVEVASKDIKNREDLRHLPFVTIDGEDAQDFDDAVFCEKTADGGWVLYVAIADVTHYLKPNTALDDEAINRGNSVYFPARVIPMLPEVLSNGLCSLKPEVDRLVMVCKMMLDSQGTLQDYQFFEGVIHSHARLTYTQVGNTLAAKTIPDSDYWQQVKEFYQLYQALLKQRKIRGAIEFDTTETRIVFDDSGKIAKIIPVVRNDAHRMIEEAMLLANVCAARYLVKADIPALFRNHLGPDEEKLQNLRDFLRAVGLRMTGGKEPVAKDYAKLVDRIQKRPDKHLIQTVLLRSMRQAVYSPDAVGHFGLAYYEYTHFTSPIRRYPDVLVHRAIKHMLGKRKPSKFRYDEEAMADFGSHFSKTERRADEATRDAVAWLKCDYMLDKVGDTFDGIIAAVTGFGVFVELNDIYIEGLVHITSLTNDYYEFDNTHHLLRGRQSNKTYRLGDPLKVKVARVDLDKRKMDLELA